MLTNEENYFAMKLWFLRNEYKGAAVQVLNVRHLDMDFQDKAALLSFSMSQEFRVSLHNSNNQSDLDMRTEYISMFSSLHYLLPEIFQNLGKIIVLDDDIVVQQDLSALWSLDMEGKVNAAQLFCSVRLGQLWSYMGENGLNGNSCAWMSGFNIIDLRRWRELQLTETYQRLLQEVSNIFSNDVLLSLEPFSYCFSSAILLSYSLLLFKIKDILSILTPSERIQTCGIVLFLLVLFWKVKEILFNICFSLKRPDGLNFGGKWNLT